MKKHILLILLSVFSLGTIQAEITWTLSDDGTLTISGTDMPNYNYPDYAPWYSQRDKIKKIVIENGVTNIGNSAFVHCPNLTSITIPESVTSIGKSVFVNSGIVSITIPNSVKSIGEGAFNGCSNLTSVTIGNRVKSIEDYTFHDCSNLTSITIGNSVNSIGNYAFENCKSLPSIILPSSVTVIGYEAFHNCLYLTFINIPNSVTSIGYEAFYNCKSLVSITIPESVTNIGAGAFGYCSSLTSITIPNSVSVASIGAATFASCPIVSITIPESVKIIEEYAFSFCSRLTSVTIPESVTKISEYAFSSCGNITTLICEAITPPDCGYACFDYVNKSIPLYVPANSINAYKEATQWKEFTNILPISVDPTLALTLTDKSADLTKGYYQKGKVTFTRNNMSVGDYATFCLPFDIDLSKMTDVFSKVYLPLNIGLLKPSGTLLMLLDEVNNNTIIKAGQTFVAKCLKSEVVFENCSDVTFDDSTPNPTPSKVKIYNFDGTSGALTQNTDVNLKIGGTYSNLTKLDKNNYRTLFSNGSFDSTTSVNPFQMYVYIDGGSLGSKVTSISFEFNDVATGIKELRMNNISSSIYDLNGRMVIEKNLKPGLYIKQGKKIVIGSR